MLWGCGVEMMWGCGSQPVALPPSLGSHTHSNILDWSCSIWFFPPYAKTHLHSFILRSGKAFLIDLNNVIFSNSHINQFCRREKKRANHVQTNFWTCLWPSGLIFSKFLNCSEEILSFGVLNTFVLVLANFIDLAIFTVLPPIEVWEMMVRQIIIATVINFKQL